MSVLSVSASATHSFGKSPTQYIYLLSGRGVQGDIHCVQTASTSNKRQVHLIPSELFTELAQKDGKGPAFIISPGALGENITTTGIELFALSEGAKLHFGDHEGHAVVRVTGLRNPRKRLSEWPKGLLDRCTVKNKKGEVAGRRIGIMGAVEVDGYVQPGYVIHVENPKTSKALGNV